MASEYTDKKLLEQLREKNKAAQKQLVQKYYSNMYSIAYRYLNRKEDVEDILQESFINAIQKIDQFQERSSLKTWLITIVINNCLMNIRSSKKNPEISVEDLLPKFDRDGFREPEPNWSTRIDAEDIIRDSRKRKLVKEAIDKLPDNYRAILLLRDIEGYSVRETSELLDITEANVKSRLHRARAALKKLLEELYRK